MTMLSDRKSLRVRLGGSAGYPVVFGNLDLLPSTLREVGLRVGRCVVVTDRNVADPYGIRVDKAFQGDGWEPLVLTLPAGETTKTPQHLHAVYEAALKWGIDRRTPVIALGGGVIGDLAGFAAATLLRGLPLVQVPTSLLAQVDASIGGKTGINHEVGKNLVGAFHQPELVYTDPDTLATLPPREWISGTAELIKHALISDRRLFEQVQQELPQFARRQTSVVHDFVFRSAAVKVDIVSRDVKEKNVRAYLNFGHTFGHALEKASGYGTITHGEAVAIGMRAALYLSRRFSTKLEHARAEALVRQIPVPPIPADLAIGELMRAMQSDKKAEAGRLNFVLLRKIGEPYVTSDVALTDVEAAWRHALMPV
jgi:3-dehydroquinate synthase